MKLALLTDSFLPHAGGSRVYYFNLFKRIADQYGDAVTIITKKVPGWQAFDAQSASESFRIIRRFHPLPDLSLRYLPRGIGPFLQSLLLAQTGRFDLFHCGDLYPQGLSGLFLKRALGFPYVAYCHGEEIQQMDRRRFQPKFRDRVYKEADRVIANADFSVKNLIRIGVENSKIAKITPGADTDRFFPQPPSEELLRRYSLQGHCVAMTVGRLILRKGHAVVIRAIAKMRSNLRNFKYLIVGTGPEEQNLRRLATDLAVEPFIIFTGYVPEANLNQYYNLCDFMVLPNFQDETGDIEGFGMVFLETNATGKPVIGGLSGGVTETVIHGQTGLLVDSTNVDELATAMSQLIENGDLRRRLGDQGLRRVREEFDWNSRAKTLRAISSEIIEEHRFHRSRGSI